MSTVPSADPSPADSSPATPTPTPTPTPTTLPGRRVLRGEVVVVFAVSLGAAGVSALLTFLIAVSASQSLSSQTTSLVTSDAPGHPWLDLLSQLVRIVLALAPVALVAHLLHRSGESLRLLGLDLSERTRDVLRGTVLAAAIGGSGLVLYLVAVRLGLNRTVVPSDLPSVWWRIPVQVLVAAENALLEEVLVAGYLLRRLSQLGWRPWPALAVSSVLRGSYHLYQGLGGFVGNIALGLVFGRLYQRWGRIGPLVVAHTLIDTVALVGYTLLVGHVRWLPS